MKRKSGAKHTPGPWRIDDNGDMTSCITAGSAGDIADTRSSVDEAANARLIAAAPELLAVCKRAALALASLISDWEQLTDYDPDNDPGHGPPPGIAELAALRAAIAKAKGEAP